MKDRIFLPVIVTFFMLLLFNVASVKSYSASQYEQNLSNFQNPAGEYAPRPLWWWVGQHIKKDRVAWQLDQLKEKGVLNPSVIYSHAPAGFTIGKMLNVSPVPFTDEWWEIFKWTTKECKKRGMTLSFSEYTTFNTVQREIIEEHPELAATYLGCTQVKAKGSEPVELSAPANLINAQAYKVENEKISHKNSLNLMKYIENKVINWTPPEGEWLILSTHVHINSSALSGTDPKVGKQIIEDLYDPFRRNDPQEFGKGFSSFFQDELLIGMSGRPFPTWKDNFIQEFKKRKGYDISEHIAALWYDIGDITPKIRIDYYDVAVALVEEAYFIPVYEYMEKHNVMHGHDQGGRGNTMAATVQYGDYFRTQRWYSAPGFDCYRGGFNFKDAKLASSIANLYDRPRVWCEAFHSSGWGVSPSDMLKWINQHYAVGANLYDKHGLYYTTYGGWWEWAPPSTHFRQPYWFNTEIFSKYITRQSYILSQGRHACDAAILYPSTTMHAELKVGGSALEEIYSPKAHNANKAMWEIARHIFNEGIDMDYVDWESLHKAKAGNGSISISDMDYRVLIFPSVSAVRKDSLLKAFELYQNGGVVVFYKTLPTDSMEAGRNDPELRDIYKKLFAENYSQIEKDLLKAQNTNSQMQSTNSKGGVCVFIPEGYENINQVINSAIERDFQASEDNIFVHHRKTSDMDIYFLHNNKDSARSITATFRSQGTVEQWDNWSGKVLPIYRVKKESGKSVVRLDFDPSEAKVIVFKPLPNPVEIIADNFSEIHSVKQDNDRILVEASYQGGGEKSITLRYKDKIIKTSKEVSAQPQPIQLSGLWDFELIPTMDNRWGDFRLPATDTMIGAEVRRLKYHIDGHTETSDKFYAVDYDDSSWEKSTYSFGQAFWKVGPFSEDTDCKVIKEQLLSMKDIDADSHITYNGNKLKFSKYDFSYRWGIELDPVLVKWSTGPHGLKQEVPDEFVDLGINKNGASYYLWTTVEMEQDTQTTFHLGSAGSASAWLNGKSILSIGGNEARFTFYGCPHVGNKATASILLRKGVNYLLLKYTQPDEGRIRGYAAFLETNGKTDFEVKKKESSALHLSWFADSRGLKFNVDPNRKNKVGWYRFTSPPNLTSFNFKAYGKKVDVWIDGKQVEIQKENAANNLQLPENYTVKVKDSVPGRSTVAIRIEYLPGIFGGLAIPEPIGLQCGKGKAGLHNWADIGLPDYSGAAVYSNNFKLEEKDLNNQVIVDLGEVQVTAEVRVNKKVAKVKFARPWRFDITDLVKPGLNQIDIYVTNTLENYYVVGTPSPYARHDNYPVSGLLGPVKIEFHPRTILELIK